MKICYEGIGQWAATFEAEGVSEGGAVKLGGNGKVTACAAGDSFCGVALCLSHDGSGCTVQLSGMAQLAYTGTAPAVGYAKLSANGSGGVKTDSNGREYLLVEVDTTEKTVTMVL